MSSFHLGLAKEVSNTHPGFNIEEMDKYFPVKEFDSIYLIDLCQPYVSLVSHRLYVISIRLQAARCRTPAIRGAGMEERAGALPGRHVLQSARMGQQPGQRAGCRQVRIPSCSTLGFSPSAGSLFTLSYSLSMIPSYFALLDRIDEL